MGWIIVVIICIVIVIVLLNLSQHKIATKTNSQGVRMPTPDEHLKDISLPASDQTDESTEIVQRNTNRQPQTYQPPTTFRPPTERHKSSVRYDWQKIYEDSIVSLFPEDFLSPASSYLQEANRLERAGAASILVEQALTKAHELDAKATELYLARWSIIKKRQK
ncbi:hypothetical protein ACFLX3_03615 [Chloroflexota bacterium]